MIFKFINACKLRYFINTRLLFHIVASMRKSKSKGSSRFSSYLQNLTNQNPLLGVINRRMIKIQVGSNNNTYYCALLSVQLACCTGFNTVRKPTKKIRSKLGQN